MKSVVGILLFAVSIFIGSVTRANAVCDDEIYGWTVTPAAGTPPPEISAASIWGYGAGFVVMGSGAIINFTNPYPDNFQFGSFEDLFYFDEVYEQWLQIPTTEGPPSPRAFYDGGIFQDGLLIYGGSTPGINNTLCLINPAEHNASYIFPISINSDSWYLNFFTLEWEEVTPTPGPRTSHTMTVDENGHVWVFGGFNNTFVNAVNDLWMFNGTWVEMLKDKEVGNPPARHSHFMVADGAGSLYIFHGRHGHTLFTDMWRYIIATNTWGQVSQTNPPDQSFSEGRAVFVNGVVTFNGGQKGGGGEMRLCSPEPQTPTNETWVFDPSLKKWTQVIYPLGDTPMPIVRSQSAVIGDCHYRWGGINFRDDNGQVIFDYDVNVRYVHSGGDKRRDVHAELEKRIAASQNLVSKIRAYRK